MTIANLPNYALFVGTGSTGPFTFSFVFLDNAEISATVTDLSGNVTNLTQNIGYSVSGAGSDTGGSVTLAVALTTGYILTVTRTMPIEQDTSLPNQGPFFATTIEAALDYLTMICQQLETEIEAAAANALYAATYIKQIVTAPVSVVYPFPYNRTMTGNEALPYLGRFMVCTIDSGGVDRILTPDPLFPSGSVIMLYNKGTSSVTFINQSIGAGQKTFFMFNGTSWE